MMKKLTVAALFAGLFAAPVFCAGQQVKETSAPAAVGGIKNENDDNRVFLVEYRLERNGKILTYKMFAKNGTQTNYSTKAAGRSVKLLILPVLGQGGVVDYQLQFVLNDDAGELQISLEDQVTLTKETVALDTPDGRLVLKFALKNPEK